MNRPVNPATGLLAEPIESHSDADLLAICGRAAEGFRHWRGSSFASRSALLQRSADLLEEHLNEFALLMAEEMGKPVRQGRAEVTKCAGALRYYAEHAESLLSAQEYVEESGITRVVRTPIGVVLAIMPWNFPFWQVIRFAAPAIAAGNCVLLKHASNVPRCARALQDLFVRAGAPDGLFQALLIPANRVGELIADPVVGAVTLTGSDAAGSAVAGSAGRSIKKSVLELGGSDPFVVLASADVSAAAAAAAEARCVNSGQSCIAAKRFIVVNEHLAAFTAGLVEHMKRMSVGDPRLESTDIGPLANDSLVQELERQVGDAVSRGARVLCGGSRITPGSYYPPTVVVDVPLESALWTEEVFGPVAPVVGVPDAEAALTVANASRYGLGASVWTRDQSEARRFASELECGMVFVNGVVHSDVRYPFGGVKASGYGRELGAEGLMEFTVTRTIRVRAVPEGE